jgi:hypothetical protein
MQRNTSFSQVFRKLICRQFMHQNRHGVIGDFSCMIPDANFIGKIEFSDNAVAHVNIGNFEQKIVDICVSNFLLGASLEKFIKSLVIDSISAVQDFFIAQKTQMVFDRSGDEVAPRTNSDGLMAVINLFHKISFLSLYCVYIIAEASAKVNKKYLKNYILLF